MGAGRLGSSSLTERYSRPVPEVFRQAAPSSIAPARSKHPAFVTFCFNLDNFFQHLLALAQFFVAELRSRRLIVNPRFELVSIFRSTLQIEAQAM